MHDKNYVPEEKKKEIEKLQKILNEKDIIGIIDLEKLPSSQFQAIKKKLRGTADIKVTRSLYIRRALEKTKDEKKKKLLDYVQGPVGLIFTKENPFKLYKFLKNNRSKAFAKPGQIAEKDLVVPAGETDLPVGPALSELKMAGVNCKIDKGKIAVAKNSVLTKKGEKVTEQVAAALSKLGIKPMQIGITLKAVYEDGVVYTPDVLDINEEEFMQNLQNAYMSAVNLSINTGYPTKQTIELMIQKAFTEAKNLAVNANIMTKETSELILAKAFSKMNALKTTLQSKGYAN